MRRRIGVLVVLVLGGTARAEDLLYVEALGKAGAYGIGYEHTFAPRLGVGVAASFIELEGQQVYTVAPYLHARIAGTGRHRLFGELGAILAHSRIPSPVDDWDGMTDTGSGGILSVGWEYARRHVVVRTSASVVAGEGGLGPTIGIVLGVRP